MSCLCFYVKERVRVSDLSGCSYISTENMLPYRGGVTAPAALPPAAQTQRYCKGDVLVSNIRPYFKKIWLADADGGCSNDVLVFRAKGNCDSRFLYYILADDAFFNYAAATARGTKMPRGDRTAIMQYEIPVLKIEAQRRIADILFPLDEKIRLNRRMNGCLQHQARLLYRQWRLENEDGYDMISLEEIAEINPDSYLPKEAWEYINYLDTGSITEGIVSEIQHISAPEKLPGRARRKVLPNDIVYSTVRPNQRHHGIITHPMENMLVSTGFAVIRCKYPNICNEFIYLALTEDRLIEELQQMAEQRASTFPAIKPSDLGARLIPCPIGKAAAGLCGQLKAIYAFIAINNEQNRTLAGIRDRLLPKLLAGELNISGSVSDC